MLTSLVKIYHTWINLAFDSSAAMKMSILMTGIRDDYELSFNNIIADIIVFFG